MRTNAIHRMMLTTGAVAMTVAAGVAGELVVEAAGVMEVVGEDLAVEAPVVEAPVVEELEAGAAMNQENIRINTTSRCSELVRMAGC